MQEKSATRFNILVEYPAYTEVISQSIHDLSYLAKAMIYMVDTFTSGTKMERKHLWWTFWKKASR